MITRRIRVRIRSYFNRLNPLGRRKSRKIRRSRAVKIRKRPGTFSHTHILNSEITRRLARYKRQTYAPITADR